MPDIIGFSGSLRRGSYNSALLRAAAEITPIEIFSIRDFPLYDADFEEEHGTPQFILDLRERIAAADGLLIASPEYNGSMSGVSKNAIDWLSRPFGNSALKDKPLAVVGAAHGRYGGVWAHDEARKSFGIAGPRIVEDLRLSVPTKALDGRHPRENTELVENLRNIVGKLAAEVS